MKSTELHNILLVGEYSGVHATLKKALEAKGFNVKIFSDGDGYKGFERDINFRVWRHRQNKFLVLINLAISFIGLSGISLLILNWKALMSLRGYDVVQLINPVPMGGLGSLASLVIFFILKFNNKSIFICGLGDDYYWVDACLNDKYKYSIFDRMKFSNANKFLHSIRYKYFLFYKTLNQLVCRYSGAVICGLYDYYKAYLASGFLLKFIPLPINESLIRGRPTPTAYPVKIFHGWQKGKELRKGNDIFDAVILSLLKKYGPDVIEYKVVQSVSYEEYKKLYDECDIFLDQLYSYDRGVNGLMGMASGKVVLTGFEPEILTLYSYGPGLPALNATPDFDYLYSLLDGLISNIDLINEIKSNAIEFVRKNHAACDVAEKYLDAWASCGKR